MKSTMFAVLTLFIISSGAQRSPYAGREPHGYPSITEPTVDLLDTRFGDDDIPTTTVKLPIEALGDAKLVKLLLERPVDQRPFWLLNWQALQANRQNPQTFQQRTNSFVDPNKP